MNNDSSETTLEVNSPQNLTDYLKSESVKHAEYHHYTTLESLEKILKYKTFIMTKGDSKKLNDLHEQDEKGEKDVWNRTYMSCFNYSEGENMAMWGLYGKPRSEAICINIPVEAFIALANSSCKQSDKSEDIPRDEIDIFATDIFYTRCNNIVKEPDPAFQVHNNKKIKFNINGMLFNYLKHKEFTGCVKSYAWNYEDEVRIIARINPEKKDIYKNDYIYLNIPEECIKSFKITTGPSFTKVKKLNKLLAKYGLLQFLPSRYKGSVRFKDASEAIDKIEKVIKDY